jgi:hypothetical protein
MIRVAALGIEHRLVGDAPLFYVDPPRMGNLYDDGWREYLTARFREIGEDTGQKLRLAIIDTVSQARAGGGKSENSNDDMTEVDTRLRAIARKTGAHVMGIHHPPKGDKTTMRGGGGLESSIDTVLMQSGNTITAPKLWEHGKDGVSLRVRREVVSVQYGVKTTLVAIVTAGHSHTEATGGDEPRSGAKYTVYVGLREDKPAVDVRRETAGDR